jgi:3,4-dihydroxy 2-butanone 4-phosphate synthase/GTP cyclohydrolase II
VNTDFTITGYASLTSSEEFVAVHCGALRTKAAVLVRIHSQCLTGDAFGSTRCDCGAQLRGALDLIAAESRGVLIYQLQEGRGIGILNKIRAYALQDQGADTVEANERLGFAADLRMYHECAEILLDLGLSRVRLLTNNPLKMQALADSGLEIVDRIPLEIMPAETSIKYLRTKQQKLGHLLNL